MYRPACSAGPDWSCRWVRCRLRSLLQCPVEVAAGEAYLIAGGEPTASEVEVKLVFGLLEQPLPHLDRDDHTLGPAVGAEIHRPPLAGVETPGDLVQGVTGLTGSNHISHTPNRT